MTDTVLQLFARPPIAGRVKTRLIPSVGADNALAIYRHCLQYNLDLVRHSRMRYQVWLSEAGIDDCFGNDPLAIQQGSNLGERMLHAMSSALIENGGDYERVILIGSDCLDITRDLLNEVRQKLNTHRLVLVPAEDGGYVLIAAKLGIDAGMFRDIDWGTHRVLSQTLDRARQAGIDICILNPLRDIDRYEDLQHYAELQSYT